MLRREFIAGLAGAPLARPVLGRAQQTERVRRIGVLLPAAAEDAQYQTWVGAFLQGLALSGWTVGRNVRIDTHWGTPNPAEIRKQAAELAALDVTTRPPFGACAKAAMARSISSASLRLTGVTSTLSDAATA